MKLSSFLTTPWKKTIIPEIIHIIQHTKKPVTYSYLCERLDGWNRCHPVDVQLQLVDLTQEGAVNINDGVLSVSSELEWDY